MSKLYYSCLNCGRIVTFEKEVANEQDYMSRHLVSGIRRTHNCDDGTIGVCDLIAISNNGNPTLDERLVNTSFNTINVPDEQPQSPLPQQMSIPEPANGRIPTEPIDMDVELPADMGDIPGADALDNPDQNQQ